MALRVVLSVPIFLLRAAKRISTAITHALVEYPNYLLIWLFPKKAPDLTIKRPNSPHRGVADRPGWFLKLVATKYRSADAKHCSADANNHSADAKHRSADATHRSADANNHSLIPNIPPNNFHCNHSRISRAASHCTNSSGYVPRRSACVLKRSGCVRCRL